jgi:lysophospholipase L1-like esterase
MLDRDDRDNAHAHPWRRMVSIGDSFTEGIGDPDPTTPGHHRGWADRIAEELGAQVPDFAYANLAVRGKLIRQIVADQIEPALALHPDLITFSAGGNEVIRPGSDHHGHQRDATPKIPDVTRPAAPATTASNCPRGYSRAVQRPAFKVPTASMPTLHLLGAIPVGSTALMGSQPAYA